MKTTHKYYFSVEGETEKWYLNWLQDKINSDPAARYKVSIDSKIQKKGYSVTFDDLNYISFAVYIR
jgi:hypothetical protein